ncbi:adenylate kinase [Paenibacillus sp. SN-8-1]|uniref:adenylate kinase n=1 Tax=Paenibacillus sp. SN-8-1 TaxID=3435409 RepID=UPI003D9A7142
MTLSNIGLIGKLRAGKDVVAAYLASNYGYTRFAFGDPLKDDFHRRYPEIPREPKPRAGYQFHGQFMREHRGENVWIDACLEAITEAESYHVADYYMYGPDAAFRAVITDVRQPNEYGRLNAEGYVLIRVQAQDGIRIQRAIESGDTFNYTDLMHGTETALDGYAADFTVTNDGSLDELYAQIDGIIATLRSAGRDAS